MLTITHTHEAGTLIEGTTRGDGTAPILKQNGWRWGRSIGQWFVPMSRDRLPKLYVIERTAAALEQAGYAVTLEIDHSTRPTAEVEAAKAARLADRADALADKAARKASNAAAAWNSHERDVASLPEGGEPIKIGHHSENRHRNAINKAHNSARRALDATQEAEETARRADVASRATDRRHNPTTVQNRIDRLTAQARRIRRDIDAPLYDDHGRPVERTEEQKEQRAARFAPALAETLDQLAYWQQYRAAQIEADPDNNYTREQIQAGDYVKIAGFWRKVVRVNPKTVSLETGYSWTDKATYAAIRDHRRPE